MINERRICDIESALLKIEDRVSFVADVLKLHRRDVLDRLKLISSWQNKADSKIDHLVQSIQMSLRAVQKIDSHCLKISDQIGSIKENLNLLLNTSEQRHHSLDQRIAKIDRRFDNLSNRFDQIQKLLNDQFAMVQKNTNDHLDRLHHELRESFKLLMTKIDRGE